MAGQGTGAGITPLADWEGRPVASWRDRWRLPILHVFDVVASTNDVARELAEHGAPGGTVIIADAQTAGRGRAGKAWHAPAGSALLLSIVLRPSLDAGSPFMPGTIPLRVGLAVARAIEQVSGIEVAIKWPNDVVVEGRGKLGGILCEASLSSSGGYVVAGIGLNVYQEEADFAPEIRPHAVSLRTLGAPNVARAEIAGAVIEEVLHLAGSACGPLEPPVLAELERHDALRGHEITVDGEPAGTAAGIAPDGALLVRCDGGAREVRAGTVRVRASQSYTT